MGGAKKIDALEGLEDERHVDLEGVLSEGLAQGETLACEEGHEGHRVVVVTIGKTLGPLGVVVLAPLVFVLMKLVNIYDHHVARADLDPFNCNTISHAKRSSIRQGRVNPHGLIEAVLKLIVQSLIEGVHVKLLRL